MRNEQQSRRRVLRNASAMALAGLPLQAASRSEVPIRLGIVAGARSTADIDLAIARVRKLGFPTCQVSIEDLSLASAQPLRQALDKHGVEATALMGHGPGKTVWNFYEGPLTIGLVPRATRQARMDALKLTADVAEKAGIPAIHTHCGFLPANPNEQDYKESVAAIKNVAAHCKERGRLFLFETGQEAPITLLRAIHDIGLNNLGVNLDMANLILYGNGNPVDAMDVLGPLVKGLHAKDGLFPTDPKNLGREVAIGKGKVDFVGVVEKLKAVNYRGAMTIEREIQGPEQTRDILASKLYLEGVLQTVYGGAGRPKV